MIDRCIWARLTEVSFGAVSLLLSIMLLTFGRNQLCFGGEIIIYQDILYIAEVFKAMSVKAVKPISGRIDAYRNTSVSLVAFWCLVISISLSILIFYFFFLLFTISLFCILSTKVCQLLESFSIALCFFNLFLFILLCLFNLPFGWRLLERGGWLPYVPFSASISPLAFCPVVIIFLLYIPTFLISFSFSWCLFLKFTENLYILNSLYTYLASCFHTSLEIFQQKFICFYRLSFWYLPLFFPLLSTFFIYFIFLLLFLNFTVSFHCFIFISLLLLCIFNPPI